MLTVNFKIYLKFVLFLWAVGVAADLIFIAWQWNDISAHPFSDTLKAFYIGLRFNGRIAAFLSLPLAFFLFMPFISNFFNYAKRWLLYFYTFVFFMLILTYMADFSNYAYLQLRINWETLEQLEDAGVSIKMVWQTYPIVRIFLFTSIFAAILAWVAKKIFAKWEKEQQKLTKMAVSYALAILLTGVLIYGQYIPVWYPLRWSEAYFSGVNAVTAIALNPVQNIFDTRPRQTRSRYNVNAVREAYPKIVEYLGVDFPNQNADILRYDRFTEEKENTKPNVVLIVAESLSTHKTSFMFEELQVTEFLKGLAGNSLYFPNYYANARTTARAMFSIISGIPDVNESFAASTRDPSVIDQHILWNEFHGYQKIFALNGSANWANLRGVITNNSEGVKIYEERDWGSRRVDVWGISDLDLFTEFHEILKNQTEPFVAVILTAGVHRPFTVPDGVEGFDYSVPDREWLREYGFEQAEFRSMRFSDFSIQAFFNLAKQSEYYENTIFVVTGDHGISEPSPSAGTNYQLMRLHEFHVPLIIHYPKKFGTQGRVMPQAGGHTDLFPTIAGIAGIKHQNTTVGRDLLDPKFGDGRMVFVRRSDVRPPVLVSGEFAFSAEFGRAGNFYRKEATNIRDDWQLYEIDETKMEYLDALTYGLLETARYILHNNTKKQAKEAAIRKSAIE